MCRESSRWNLARQFGCHVAGWAGAAILVSLSHAFEFLFEAEEWSVRGMDSQRASGQVEGAVFPVESFGDAVEGVSLVVRLFWDYIRLGRREFPVSAIFPSDDCPWGLSKCVWKRCVLVYRRQCFPLTIRAKMTLAVACRTRSSTHGE